MLELGTNHPDFIYANDLIAAKLSLAGSIFAAILGSILIVAGVLH